MDLSDVPWVILRRVIGGRDPFQTPLERQPDLPYLPVFSVYTGIFSESMSLAYFRISVSFRRRRT